MKQILIVEDDAKLSEGLFHALQSSNAAILQCDSVAGARQSMGQSAVDLVILDINLPDGSGLDLLRDIKKAAGPPVILLTANDTEMDVVLGLETGAADYITKPFSLAILRARVNAQLRAAREASSAIISIGDYTFDFKGMAFFRRDDMVELSKTEQKLLRILVDSRGATVPRETLLGHVWPDGSEYVDENTLSVAIKRLRDKLNAGEYIKTVYGIGYTWAVE